MLIALTETLCRLIIAISVALDQDVQVQRRFTSRCLYHSLAARLLEICGRNGAGVSLRTSARNYAASCSYYLLLLSSNTLHPIQPESLPEIEVSMKDYQVQALWGCLS